MNVVFIIPTGLGCEIGGHAGDATPAARLIAETCDKLILHPNVVNASDINEMPDNALYVEGSMLDRFLEGHISLKEVCSNKILVAVNKPWRPDTVNAVSAARATLGINAEVIELNTPLVMKGYIKDGVATGEHSGVPELISQLGGIDSFDALAICSEIQVSPEIALEYFKTGGVNPWGGIEAEVSRMVSESLNKPVAHAPIESESTKNSKDLFHLLYDEVVDPRMAAEVCSNCYTYCVLKGLHKAPRPVYYNLGISVDSVGCLITPTGCIGRPHEACLERGIPIIAVKGNDSFGGKRSADFIYVENYIEAAGMVLFLKSGLSYDSVMRLSKTEIR